MTTPAPSPMMKPSRSRSNGRLARDGSSLRVDRARSWPKPPRLIGVIAASDGAEAADPRTDERPDIGRVLPGDLQLRIVNGELGGGDRVLDEEVHLLDDLLLDPRERIEPLDFSGNLRGVRGHVETRHAAD